MNDVHKRLAAHLQKMTMGYPFSEQLLDLLKQLYSQTEAEVMLAVSSDLLPLEMDDLATIQQRSSLPPDIVRQTLERLAARNLIYSGRTPDGNPGYALLQVGYGMPQTFFWQGLKADDNLRKTARLVLKYFNTAITQQIYGGTATKTYKYVPATTSINIPLQGVYPHDRIEPLLEGITKFAVAHCPCRISARILGRTDCHHSLEVCLKYDEMADFILTQGLGREISKDEAYDILQKCEQEGLVHMVDNVKGQVKHTCNCCGHYCWNVGMIRRRSVPRDSLMAVYFIRITDEEECIGCGACAEICPVDAVDMESDLARVDPRWCIGCGVCVGVCPTAAISLSRRTEKQPADDFHSLHRTISKAKGLES